MVAIMITNGGSHPADKWAEITADQILNLIEIDAASETPAALAARRAKRTLRTTLCDALEPLYAGVQNAEKQQLTTKGLARINEALDVRSHLDAPLSAVADCFAGTPFQAHFAKPEVREVLKRIIGQHCANMMHIERSYSADKSPKSAEAQAFRAKHA
jgi:hypothetical protein